MVRAWRRCDRVAAARQADARHLHRGLRTYVDDDGMLVVHGRLTPEQGAVVQRALEAAADQLWREAREAAAPDTVVAEVTPAQRRADALARLAETALAGGLDGGTAGDRYQVVLHVDAAHDAAPGGTTAVEDSTLEGRTLDTAMEGAALDSAVIECGDRAVDVSAETSARLTCDASVVVMREDATGATLDVGRKTRTVPPAIRRALEARDTGCRFPGCTARRCDAHHVVHWAEGGPTRLDNLVLLCRRHHRLLHEGGYSIRPEATPHVHIRQRRRTHRRDGAIRAWVDAAFGVTEPYRRLAAAPPDGRQRPPVHRAHMGRDAVQSDLRDRRTPGRRTGDTCAHVNSNGPRDERPHAPRRRRGVGAARRLGRRPARHGTHVRRHAVRTYLCDGRATR